MDFHGWRPFSLRNTSHQLQIPGDAPSNGNPQAMIVASCYGGSKTLELDFPIAIRGPLRPVAEFAAFKRCIVAFFNRFALMENLAA